jgi:hypothetical protein
MNPLRETQRRFFLALRDPLRGGDREAAGLPPREPAPIGDPGGSAALLIRSTDTLGARERLGLYQRQYWFRLLDSLAEDFPDTRRLLGREVFQAVLERYLEARTPDSWNLRRLGAGLADFLAGERSLEDGQRAWACALATRESALLEAFEAPELPEPPDEALGSASLILQPCVRLLRLALPVSAWTAETGALPPGRRGEFHVVWRSRGRRLLGRAEPPSLRPLLESLALGGTLGEVFGRLGRLPSERSLAAAFARWRADGWLALRPESAATRIQPYVTESST